MLNLDKFPAKLNFLKTKIRLILCTSMFCVVIIDFCKTDLTV